ncbi:hypothetical protein IW146_008298 [Coemansia sp. RSA 922]|nr:hypothetical protein IW146_008298 [Coemansia sp. RSA 922]
MDKLAFLIKNMWAASGNGSADDVHERLFLNVLHAKFDKSSKFNGSFVQLISAGPVYINRGDTAVADLTTTAFVGLPSMTQDAAKDSDNAQGSSNSCVHQHSHTVAKWTENMIFKAESESQVVVVVANTMAALNAVYVKCNIPHGNISDCAILLQQTVDGIKGVLAEFDYACYACYADDNSGVDKVPELMLFQSMCSLNNPRVVCTFLDDCESLLYLMCWLGTFGINKAEWVAYITGLPRNPRLPIMDWN